MEPTIFMFIAEFIADTISRLELLVSIASGWRRKRPNRPCVLLTRNKFGKTWEYDLHLLEMVDGHNAEGSKARYLGWLDKDGVELDDINDMHYQQYKIISRLSC